MISDDDTRRITKLDSPDEDQAAKPPYNNPWLRLAGKYKDDSQWDDFQANIADYRRQLNEEEDLCRLKTKDQF
ncbi:MAG: hypothetical protein AAB401_02410 [Acidobacteriota bacterium]